MPDETVINEVDETDEVDGEEEQVPESYDAWLETQPAVIRSLLDDHVKGLKGALETERGNRKDLEKKVRDLATKAEKGSELEKHAITLADSLKDADARADFYEEAHLAGVTNLKLAYVVTQQDKLFDRYGKPDLMKLREGYPELFKAEKPKVTPAGNAGSGTGGEPPKRAGMNEWIRKSAGR